MYPHTTDCWLACRLSEVARSQVSAEIALDFEGRLSIHATIFRASPAATPVRARVKKQGNAHVRVDRRQHLS